jgi:hypothetical protein
MQVIVNTDKHIAGRERLARWVEGEVEDALGRFGEQPTRVEVHLNDSNSPARSGGDDKRCLLEARLAGVQPVAVTHHAASLREAVAGALDRMEKSLDRKLGRLATLKGHTTGN